jgi:hypothetical protein
MTLTPGEISGRVGQPRPSRRAMPPKPPPPAPEGRPKDTGFLVPVDTWDKVLAQLGNLHQAGQELADARERAAKAEVEAQFLRERLGELRTERDSLKTERDQLRGLVEGYRDRLDRQPPEPSRRRRWWPR